MKKKLASAFLLMTMCAGILPASQNDCCSTESCSGFSFYADYLYWKVCESDIDFSRDINEGDEDVTITEYLNPGYDSGWRIGGLYRCESWDIGARYTDYCTTAKEKLSSPPFDEEATETFKFDWDVVDIEFGYTLSFDCDRYMLRPFGGVKLAWVKESFDNELGESEHKQKFDGYGLYIGGEGRYLFCRKNVCCSELEISILFRGSYGILDSTSNVHTVSGEDSVSDRKGECLFVSTIEVFAGLDFGYQCSDCFTPHLLLGYEAHTMLGWREMDSSNDRATLGLGGLVARFRFDF